MVIFQQEEYTIRRIVGLPGERIRLGQDDIYINELKIGAFRHGVGFNDAMSIHMRVMGKFACDSDYLIPEGCVFVVGDDYYRAYDSRNFGAIPISDIVGKYESTRKLGPRKEPHER